MQENIKQNNAKNYIFYHHRSVASLESMKVTMIKLLCLCRKKLYCHRKTCTIFFIFCLWEDILFGLLLFLRTVTDWGYTGTNSNLNSFHISISYTNNTLLRTSDVYVVIHKMLINNVYCSLILKLQMCFLGYRL